MFKDFGILEQMKGLWSAGKTGLFIHDFFKDAHINIHVDADYVDEQHGDAIVYSRSMFSLTFADFLFRINEFKVSDEKKITLLYLCINKIHPDKYYQVSILLEKV